MTEEEEKIKKELDTVANYSDKNEKLSWKRKMKKLGDLVDDLRPYEEEILKLVMKKQPIMDKIDQLRDVMVKECIHPIDYLSHRGDHILCKFCNSKIKVVDTDE